MEIFQILSSPPFDYRNCCQRFHFVLPPPPPLIASRINVNESNATKVEFVHPCSRVMSTIGRRGGRVAAGCRQPPCRFAASLFAPNRWFVHLAGQHFGPLRTVEADRERERGEQGGPGGDAMMRSRHMLRPLGDSAYTRLLINSQAFVLANSTGEITPRNNLSFFFSFFFRRQSTATDCYIQLTVLPWYWPPFLRSPFPSSSFFTTRVERSRAKAPNSRESKGQVNVPNLRISLF